jgi:nicotinate-nucleotide pyrophosphorylase (carboxylating)
MHSTTFLTIALASLAILGNAQEDHSTESGQYTLTDDFTYKNFFSAFDFFDGPDPTKGFVKYQNQELAIKQGLVGFLDDTQSVFIGVDYKTKDSVGRASVRLESRKSWNRGLLITDIIHMPSSQCGAWPAFWLLSSSAEWPKGGEVDILEGVNDYESNSVTLHTTTGCIIDNSTSTEGESGAVGDIAPFTGLMSTDDCNVAALGQEKNVGCSIHAPKTMTGIQTRGGSGDTDNSGIALFPSYGTQFNKAQGGVYAMEWTATGISVWFFPRDSPGFTERFSFNVTVPDPASWGIPIAHFGGSGCDFSERFQDLKIIFNTAFCGEWAGAKWDESCAKKTDVATCNEYVRENPEVFKEAYWKIAGLKWFQKDATQKRDTIAPLMKHARVFHAPIIKNKAKDIWFGW